MHPVAPRLRELFASAVTARAKPLLIIVLLESLRPAETGYFNRKVPSLTPHLDRLADQGIAFTHAYSTGSVTRGGQEAVLCGYLGSRDTSLMRSDTRVQVACLPDLTVRSRLPSERGEAFWYHGGDARFDNQLEFWREHQIKETLTERDFAAAVPRTGWGVGDVSFFARAGKELRALRERTPSSYLLGLLLSVTNHIPWQLPRDLPPSAVLPTTSAHPSYITTAYTDAALGQFVEDLRTSGLWTQTVLMVLSDHGNNVPPYSDLYGQDALRDGFLQSHINFFISGGMTEQALRAIDAREVRLDHTVSQAGAAALAAYIVGLPDARFMADNPLRLHSQLPVVARLEESLFVPRLGRLFSEKDVARQVPPTSPPEERHALLFYRAFLEHIFQGY